MNLDFSKLKSLNIEGIDLVKLIIGQYYSLVPTSIDTNGSIFNGCGYIDGYRLSSSGALKEQSDTVTTGYIPYAQNSIITITGAKFLKHTFSFGSRYHYLAFYDKNFKKLSHLQVSFSASGYTLNTRGAPSVNMNTTQIIENELSTTITLSFNESAANIAYFRINAFGSGLGLNVSTSTNPIDLYTWKRAFVNLVPTSIDTNGSIFNGCGYITGYTMNIKNGSLTSQANTITTGFIPIIMKKDKIRMSGVDWMSPPSDSYYCICLYDDSFTFLTSAYHNGSNVSDRGISSIYEAAGYDVVQDNNSIYNNVKTDTNGVTTVNLTAGTHSNAIRYIRISAGYTGQEMVVTKNEEII